MTTEWHDVLDKLLALMRLDLKIERLERDLERAPADLKQREAAIAAIDDRGGKVSERVKLLKAQIMLRENERNTHLKKIEKLKAQASEVRSNKEFVAFRSEISNTQSEVDRLDGEMLKIMEVVELAEAKTLEYDAERAREVELADKAQAEIDDKLADVRAMREGLLKDRPALREGIPTEALQAYERAHEARGRGMAALEGAYCTGCGELQTRNDVYLVQNRARLVPCRACNRILFQS
ncbi:MAG: hypothetical protein O2894_10735 [Planctomycetota bacterium]|nr:hypothetical protein [Planctomycetota bacterium]